MAQTETKALNFSRIKGALNLLRITNLNVEVLTKAAALNQEALVLKDENGRPDFVLTINNNETTYATPYVLSINSNQYEDNVVIAEISSDNVDATTIRVVKYATELYNKAQELAKSYDEALKNITTI